MMLLLLATSWNWLGTIFWGKCFLLINVSQEHLMFWHVYFLAYYSHRKSLYTRHGRLFSTHRSWRRYVVFFCLVVPRSSRLDRHCFTFASLLSRLGPTSWTIGRRKMSSGGIFGQHVVQRHVASAWPHFGQNDNIFDDILRQKRPISRCRLAVFSHFRTTFLDVVLSWPKYQPKMLSSMTCRLDVVAAKKLLGMLFSTKFFCPTTCRLGPK